MNYDSQTTKSQRLKRYCLAYFREVRETSIRAVLLLIATTVITLIVLFFYKILWHIFTLTYSGRKYIELHPEASGVLRDIVNNELIEISVNSTFSAFIICLIIGAICRISYLTRYLFYPQSTIAKFLFWGAPLTALVSLFINGELQLAHWSYTIPITIVPTFCVFSYCFKFAETLLPEIGDAVVIIYNSLKNFFSLTSPQER